MTCAKLPREARQNPSLLRKRILGRSSIFGTWKNPPCISDFGERSTELTPKSQSSRGYTPVFPRTKNRTSTQPPLSRYGKVLPCFPRVESPRASSQLRSISYIIVTCAAFFLRLPDAEAQEERYIVRFKERTTAAATVAATTERDLRAAWYKWPNS